MSRRMIVSSLLFFVLCILEVKSQPAIVCSAILNYNSSTFCGDLVPPKMCMYAISEGFWDATDFTADDFQQTLEDFNATALCPKSPKHAKKPSKRSYCHADAKDGLADGPCNTDEDCLKQMVCYSACALCFELSVCEYAASMGGIALQNQTTCYNPVPIIARVYWKLPLYGWIMIIGSSLTFITIIVVGVRCYTKNRKEYYYESINSR